MTDVSDAIERLRARFCDRAAADLDNLQLWSSDPAAHGAQLHALVHRLAGAAGTFGFQRLSALAAKAEDALLAASPDRTRALAEVMGELARIGAPGPAPDAP